MAESLFRSGRDLVSAGKIAEACPKFAESQRLDPRVGTLIYLATCHEQEGKTATAWIEFTEAASAAQRSKQQDREKLARQRIQALEQKLARVTVTLASPADETELQLDGSPVGRELLNAALPVDPGEHALSASSPGKKPLSFKVNIPEGPSTTVVPIPRLEDATEPPPPSPQAVEKPPPRPLSEQRADSSSRRLVGYALGGVGVVALGFGTYFGLRAVSLKGDAEQDCVGRLCTPGGLATYDEARSAGVLSTVGFVAGAVGLGAGVYFILSAGASSKPSAVLRPSFSPRAAGASVEVGW